MWHWALEWSRTRKARRAVVAAISPIVEDSRHRLSAAHGKILLRCSRNLMTEQLPLLSADRNRDFELGCHNAAAFSSVLFGATTLNCRKAAGLPSPKRWRDNLKANLTVRATCGVSSMWTQFFGVHSLQMYQNAAPAK
jgi:hypothetical protein